MFRVTSKIGSGSFGDVFLATRENDGERVALKMVPKYGHCTSREVSILQQLDHPNIVKLYSHFYCNLLSANTAGTKRQISKSAYVQPKETRAQIVQVIVMKYYPLTLKQFIQKRGPLTLDDTKFMMKQLFEAVSYTHIKDITHRDIKSSNILINPDNLHLVLADFGCAKDLNEDPFNIIYIGSRYYRAPELLLSSESYTNKIDIWAIGCVLYECLDGVPPFQGKDTSDQIVQIFRHLGNPSVNDLLKMNNQHLVSETAHLPQQFQTKTSIQTRNNEAAMSLLDEIFVYDPVARISAIKACEHAFFD